ncbi:DEK domain-containing chromatin-associated protein 1 [Lolium perenne]|uniref:DEK domain-containing chromatin-associated protein 1 n=1 Tax=Lolium perenne TaxID=4522 RepID=UPI0021F53F5B|nr:DEK domain-containing chromatin-associated protein 1 [Lolium perenne]
MATDAKPASPAPEDPMDAEPEAEKAESGAEEEEEQEDDGDEEEQQPKKRGRRKMLAGEERPLASPASERPSRERKTVERYAELTPRSTSAKKTTVILQGPGTMLKEIPNVSFKLSKRKSDEVLQSLHTIMFGKKSRVHFLKRNISQFSGFVWIENEDKQRTKVKDKLDKFNKEKLLDFCEILDINVKGTLKKEEVSAKLLEFLESPCITRDVVLTEVKKGKKRGRKSKASGQSSAEGASGEKKKRKSRKQAVEAEKENDEEDAGPAGSEDVPMGEDDDSEAQEDAGSDEEPEETPAKKKSTDGKQGKKEAGSKVKENDASGKKASTKPAKAKPDVEPESKKAGKKASKSSTKEPNTPVDKATKKASKPKKDEKENQSNNKTPKKRGAKASSENKGKGKGSTDAGSAPTTKELHAVVSDILKEVDFNTATLADILRKLGAHFKMDLMDRKSEVKRIIEEVINSMSDDEGEEENDEDAEENGKKENSKEDPDEDEK